MDPIRRLEEAKKQTKIVLDENPPPAVRHELEAAQQQLTTAIETLTNKKKN